jgi:hypothetical protein
VLKLQHEPLHPAIAPGQVRRQVRSQAPQREQQRLRRLHLVAQFDPQVEAVRRLVPVQRYFAITNQLVQVPQHGGREAPCNPVARQRPHLAQRAHAHAREGGRRFRPEPGALDRQLPKRAAQRRPGVDRQPVVDIGQRARRHRIWRGHDAVREPQLPQLLAQPRLKPRPRPKQPQAALDLHQQCVRPAGADLRAEAIRPCGQEAMPARLLVRIVIDRGETARQRLRRGQRHPPAQAQRARRRIDRVQHPPLARTGHQRQRRIGVGAAAQRAVQRQPRQQDAGPAHGSARRPDQRTES